MKIANVVRHEAGAWAEQSDVAAALFHQAQLVGFNRFAQFVVADFQVAHFGHAGRVFDARDLFVAPFFQRFGCSGVVAVAVDDQWFLLAHRCC